VAIKVKAALSDIGQLLGSQTTTTDELLGVISRLEQTFVVSLKKCLANLLLFIALDTSNFATIDTGLLLLMSSGLHNCPIQNNSYLRFHCSSTKNWSWDHSEI